MSFTTSIAATADAFVISVDNGSFVVSTGLKEKSELNKTFYHSFMVKLREIKETNTSAMAADERSKVLHKRNAKEIIVSSYLHD